MTKKLTQKVQWVLYMTQQMSSWYAISTLVCAHVEDLQLFAAYICHIWPPVQHARTRARTHAHTHTHTHTHTHRTSSIVSTESPGVKTPNPGSQMPGWESPPWESSHTVHYNGTTSHSNNFKLLPTWERQSSPAYQKKYHQLLTPQQRKMVLQLYYEEFLLTWISATATP
jgi:hypothetical protein